jgi:hypothetical protein
LSNKALCKESVQGCCDLNEKCAHLCEQWEQSGKLLVQSTKLHFSSEPRDHVSIVTLLVAFIICIFTVGDIHGGKA